MHFPVEDVGFGISSQLAYNLLVSILKPYFTFHQQWLNVYIYPLKLKQKLIGSLKNSVLYFTAFACRIYKNGFGGVAFLYRLAAGGVARVGERSSVIVPDENPACTALSVDRQAFRQAGPERA
jgi:hypothetical protein